MIGRVGADPQLVTTPAVESAYLRLGQETRLAFASPPQTVLTVRSSQPVTRMVLSLGLETEGEAPTSVRFVVESQTGTRSQTLLEETLTQPDAWHDIELAFSATSPAPEEFRFRAVVAPSERGSTLPYFGSVAFLGPPGPGASTEGPNIVLISLDTLGAHYLGIDAEQGRVSPTIDRLLQQSFSFDRAFAQYPNTLVSHSSMFSGLYPRRAPDNPQALGGLANLRAQPSLVGRLAAAGYLTAAVTENGYVGSTFGFRSGFDLYDDGPSPKLLGNPGFAGFAPQTFAVAARLAEQLGSRAPFFLFVHTYEVHNPYRPQTVEAQRVADERTPRDSRPYRQVVGERPRGRSSGYSEEDRRRLEALYVGGIHALDTYLSDFLDQLSQLPRASRTLVVILSDHGEEFERTRVGHGGLDNTVLHVPLAFFWPGVITPGRSRAVVQLVDVMPTILKLAGLEIPPGLPGRSLVGVIEGSGEQTGARAAFSSSPGGYALQTERFKLVRDSQVGEALFDLSNDPNEQADVADAQAQVAAALRSELDARIDSMPEAARFDVEALDDATRERLRTLGYIE